MGILVDMSGYSEDFAKGLTSIGQAVNVLDWDINDVFNDKVRHKRLIRHRHMIAGY